MGRLEEFGKLEIDCCEQKEFAGFEHDRRRQCYRRTVGECEGCLIPGRPLLILSFHFPRPVCNPTGGAQEGGANHVGQLVSAGLWCCSNVVFHPELDCYAPVVSIELAVHWGFGGRVVTLSVFVPILRDARVSLKGPSGPGRLEEHAKQGHDYGGPLTSLG